MEKRMKRLLPYCDDNTNRPHITLSVKIEREADTFVIYDMMTFNSIMYTFKERVGNLFLSRVCTEYDYSADQYSTNSMYVELRGGGYGAEVEKYLNDPTTDKHTPGHQRCYYSTYSEKFYMVYKDEEYEISQPFNLTPEEGTYPSRYDDDFNEIRPEPTQQFSRNVRVSFTFGRGYSTFHHATLEAVSIIPRNIQLSRFRARMLAVRGYDRDTFIQSIHINEAGDYHIIIERDSEWCTPPVSTPGYQRYEWDFFDGDEPYFVDRMFYKNKWHEARLPFSEEELEMARNCQ